MRYHFSTQSSLISKFFHIELHFHFESLESNNNKLVVKSLFMEDGFPIVHDITRVNQRYLVTFYDANDDSQQGDWTNTKIEQINNTFTVTNNQCTACGLTEFRCIPFHSEFPQVNQVKLFSTRNKYSYICARTIDRNDSLLCTNTELESGYWHDLVTTFPITNACIIGETVIVQSGKQLLYKGKSFTSQEYHEQFVPVLENEKIIKIGSSGSSFYALNESRTLYRFTMDNTVTVDGVIDFVDGYGHIIVMVENGLIWYSDRNGDFQPEHTYDMRFKDPSTIRFIVNNEKSTILWTRKWYNIWLLMSLDDNRCFVIGVAPNLVGVAVNRWCEVVLTEELQVKKIIGFEDLFFILTQDGQLWRSGSSDSGFVQVKDIQVLTDEENFTSVSQVVDISCTRKNLLILF
jgi:hypothetical protein